MSSEGRVVRPYIGIKMLQLNPHNTAQMHEKDKHFPALDQGILVPSVYPGSPAAKAGLKPGDIITGMITLPSHPFTIPWSSCLIS